jgi:H/ACA ribonucleoprotein complex non-core subunit NAF1
LSPTSTIIAQATGQYPASDVSSHSEYPGGPSDYTPFPPQLQQFGFAQPYLQQQQQQQFTMEHSPTHSPIQPHINPRFASRFGLNFDMMQPQTQPQQYPAYYQYGSSWDGQWSHGYNGEHDDVKYDHGHNSSGS